MDFGLRGRNALVFGGTRGIGRAIANTLAVEGADVAICARNADQVKNNVAARLRAVSRPDLLACLYDAARMAQAEFMADMKPRIEATKKNLFWRLNE
jgi:NAD(P)-dependent dehydrogenase (short-subunit alcohol dehydrogenase family)